MRIETLDTPVTVFNFEVEDHHTYYAGHTPILTHNANYPPRSDLTIPQGYSFADDQFTGALRGEQYTVEIPGQPFTYIKRPASELAQLRATFDRSTRREFLTALSKDRDTLRTAGLTDEDIANMAIGRAPDDWQVHHKHPLDDSGTNDFDNLVLIKTEPFHKVITNYQNVLTRGKATGYTVETMWPTVPGSVFPPTSSNP